MKSTLFSTERCHSPPAVVLLLTTACIGLVILLATSTAATAAAADSSATTRDHDWFRRHLWTKPLPLGVEVKASCQKKPSWYRRRARAVLSATTTTSKVGEDQWNAAAAATSSNQKGFFSRFQQRQQQDEKNDSPSSKKVSRRSSSNDKGVWSRLRTTSAGDSETEGGDNKTISRSASTQQSQWWRRRSKNSNPSTSKTAPKEEAGESSSPSDTGSSSGNDSDSGSGSKVSKSWFQRLKSESKKNVEESSSSSLTGQDDTLEKKKKQSGSTSTTRTNDKVALPAETTPTDKKETRANEEDTSFPKLDTKKGQGNLTQEQTKANELESSKQQLADLGTKEEPKVESEKGSVLGDLPVTEDDVPKGLAKDDEKTKEGEKKDIEIKKSTRGRLWQRKEKKPEKKEESGDKESSESDKKESTLVSTNATTVTEVPPTNKTVVPATQPTNTTVAPATKQPTGIIIASGMSPGGPAFRGYYRRGPPGTGPPMPQHGPSSKSIVFAEMFASLVATVGRLWFLTWLTRRLASAEESMHATQHYVWERLNDRYRRDSAALQTALKSPPAGVSKARWRARQVQKRVRKRRGDLSKVFTRTVVVVELSDDPKEGITLSHFAEVVTFLLHEHNNSAFGVHKQTGEPMELEVVIMVQSPGGSVATYGLAAAQMERLSKSSGIKTTVCVDKYAASGGYMVACQAHKLIAAPFSTLGSIGVIMEGLNFNELAQRYGIQPVVVKAGTNKNTLSTFGSISRRDLRHEEERIAKVHEAFQQLVIRGRPCLADNISSIADGSVYLGKEALDLQLVDAVMTSEEYLLERIFSGDRVLKLHRSYQARYSLGRMTISPLELLPHLKAWISKIKEHPEQYAAAITRTVQLGGFLGFIKHLFDVYASINRGS